MARSGVLSGRTFADVVYTTGILAVLMLSGLVVGWRVHSSVGDFLLAVLLMVFFTYAMAWVGVFLGLVAPTVETVQQLGFLIVFPLTFLSNAFVPTETLPEVLPADRRVEPDQRPDAGDARALRQSRARSRRARARASIRICSRCSGRSRSSSSSRRSR